MAGKGMKYCEYFNIDEDYFPCIDESAINSGAKWETTYPHEKFISLLKTTELMLGGSTNRSIWIHGAYGTGKSQCAYALKKILEVPEDELREYWDRFEPLKKEPALLEKIIGHKKQGIMTAYRYASGSISTPQQLFFAVQESVKNALIAHDVPYKGENSLKESVIAWLEDSIHANLIDALLQRPKWMSLFSQSTAEEIINSLRKSSDAASLMNNIFALAAEEGITALNLTSDSLRSWILDIIHQNNIKIVFIWDEFSDYFRQNGDSLGEFQKLVSICQEAPFYLMIVTHPLSSLTQHHVSANDKTNPWTVVQQRFDKVEITLPDNIAFDLIGHAFDVKPAAMSQWRSMTDELNSDDADARAAVVRAANIKNDAVMRDILPLHPMAALVLKNIASAFQSNQRSMFDFIKTPKELEVKAFQWFIQNTGPLDDRPFLTVDMLWDFFYEKGKDYLTSDIRLILDTFPQQKQLTENEKIVLQAILIMQAIDQRLGGTLPILKPTDQNITYVFEGDQDVLKNECRGIAKGLVAKGILIETTIADNKKVYSSAVLAGDSGKIEQYKKEIRASHGTTAKLVAEGPDLATALNLTPPLKLRYALEIESGKLPIVTIADFKKQMDALKNKDSNWHFYAVLAVAKTDDEAMSFRTLIKNTISDPAYQNIVVIDALSTPLTLEAFEQYVYFSAMSMYYSGNNNQQAKDNAQKAKNVLQRTWKDRISSGHFIVYTYANQEGEKANGAGEVHTILQTIVLTKFRYVQDFTKGLTESQLKLSTASKIARYGIGGMEIKGLILGCEKTVLGKVWNKLEYWKDEALADESIVIIKKAVDSMIADAFKTSGKISIGAVYDLLESTYGFSECNLSCFITGFLLKEYSSEPYRCMDSEGHRDAMTPDKLSEMIGNNFGKKKQSYIVSLTEEEKAFYEMTEAAWEIEPNTCSSPSHASSMVLHKMRDLAYPVWCLEEVDSNGVFDIVKMYIELVQSSGDYAHDIANRIGKIAIQRPSSTHNLNSLLKTEKCKKGMELFLKRFENGKLLALAEEIGAKDVVLVDIKELFSVEYSAIWIGATGEDQIRKLTTEYEVIKLTNLVLNVREHTRDAALRAWRDYLKFIGFSCESICAEKPDLATFFKLLRKIAAYEDMLPDDMKALLGELTNKNTEIRNVLNNTLAIFREVYAPYLEGFSESECEEIKNSIKAELFTETTTSSNAIVKTASENYRKNQLKSQLFALWKKKAGGTKNPRAWSEQFRTPILICVNASDYAEAKRTFTVLNSASASETEIKAALLFLQHADFFADIANSSFRDRCFISAIIGDYSSLLTDLNAIRDALESLGISAYDWNDNPCVKDTIAKLASREYNAGGSDQVISEIENMKDEELRAWLTEIVKKDMGLGVKIIKNRKG